MSKIIAKIKKHQKFVRKMAVGLFNHPLYLFAFFLFIDLIVGFALSWRLILFPKVVKMSDSPLVLNKNALDAFVKSWEDQEKAFGSVGSMKYPDVFLGMQVSQSNQNTSSSQNILK